MIFKISLGSTNEAGWSKIKWVILAAMKALGINLFVAKHNYDGLKDMTINVI